MISTSTYQSTNFHCKCCTSETDGDYFLIAVSPKLAATLRRPSTECDLKIMTLNHGHGNDRYVLLDSSVETARLKMF